MMTHNLVFKYPLEAVVNQVVRMPSGAQILHVGEQALQNQICLWALVAPGAPLENREILIAGTGNTEIPEGAIHLGSIIQIAFVWHIFEIK